MQIPARKRHIRPILELEADARRVLAAHLTNLACFIDLEAYDRVPGGRYGMFFY